MRVLKSIVLCGLLLSTVVASPAAAASFVLGSVSYLSTANIPAGFYAAGPAAVETFEDGILSFGITASGGGVVLPGAFTDSVDFDDESIDGFGTAGVSWYTESGAVTFTFSALPTAAGLVWTDGVGTITFEAFGIGMVSLGVLGPVGGIPDAMITGETAEDRFFGVQHAAGIMAIRVSNTFGGIETDHVQFGGMGEEIGVPGTSAVPEPSTLALLAAGGLVGLCRCRRRSRS